MKNSKQRKCIQIIKLTLITIKKSFLEEKKNRSAMSVNLNVRYQDFLVVFLSQYNDSMSKITSHHNTVCYKLQTLKKRKQNVCITITVDIIFDSMVNHFHGHLLLFKRYI